MKTILIVLGVSAMTAVPAAAEIALGGGDPAAGEKAFKQCQTCHVVQAADGTLLAGKAGKTGPNLFGVIGRTAGTYPDFKYGDSMVAAGAQAIDRHPASEIGEGGGEQRSPARKVVVDGP